MCKEEYFQYCILAFNLAITILLLISFNAWYPSQHLLLYCLAKLKSLEFDKSLPLSTISPQSLHLSILCARLLIVRWTNSKILFYIIGTQCFILFSYNLKLLSMPSIIFSSAFTKSLLVSSFSLRLIFSSCSSHKHWFWIYVLLVVIDNSLIMLALVS